MPNHSPRALVPGSYGDCGASFLVTGSLMQNQPDQTTLSMGNDADGLIMSEVTTFFGPGLIKSYLTLRTGNAWVHLWAYHAIAPHVISDTPVVVKIFGIY